MEQLPNDDLVAATHRPTRDGQSNRDNREGSPPRDGKLEHDAVLTTWRGLTAAVQLAQPLKSAQVVPECGQLVRVSSTELHQSQISLVYLNVLTEMTLYFHSGRLLFRRHFTVFRSCKLRGSLPYIELQTTE